MLLQHRAITAGLAGAANSRQPQCRPVCSALQLPLLTCALVRCRKRCVSSCSALNLIWVAEAMLHTAALHAWSPAQLLLGCRQVHQRPRENHCRYADCLASERYETANAGKC